VQVADDLRTCPSALAGQFLACRPPRSLTSDHAIRIRDRGAEYPLLKQELSACVADHGYTKSWQQAAGMTRLALAVRSADSDQPIQPPALYDLPRLRDTVAGLARRDRLLRTALPTARSTREALPQATSRASNPQQIHARRHGTQRLFLRKRPSTLLEK